MATKPLDLAQFEGHTPKLLVSSTFLVCDKLARIAANCQPLVDVPQIALPFVEAKANAKLFAAAPALLALAREQQEQIKRLEAALALAAGTFNSIYLEAAAFRKNSTAQKLGKWAYQGNEEARAALAATDGK